MNILFITSTRIGDAVLSSGLLHHLLQAYPTAQFTIAAGPIAAELFMGMPRLERLHIVTKQPYGWHWPILWSKVVAIKWDMVIDLRNSLLSYLVLTSARYILKPRHSNDHRVIQLGNLFQLNPPPAPHLWTNSIEDEQAKNLIPSGLTVLAIAPTANWNGKQWPAPQFIKLLERLTQPDSLFPSAKVAVFGAKNEYQQASPILDSIPIERRLNFVGNSSLSLVYALLKRCTFFIGNDSGVMHLAAAAGIPTLGLFGPSRIELYHPWGKYTAAVRTPESFEDFISAPGYDYRTQRSLMGSLTVEKVEQQVYELWQKAYGAVA
ncbi:MAG: glycosyltransferase family 9 protein [Alphaproteobacteria bacterium]